MKTAIIYKTLLGTTKQYAEWLKEEIKTDVFKFNEASKDKLKEYDLIIVGSGIYAGKMPLVGYLEKVWDVVANKDIIILAVGAAPADNEITKQAYQTIPEKIREKVKYFKLQGKIWKKLEEKVKKENLNPVIEYIQNIR